MEGLPKSLPLVRERMENPPEGNYDFIREVTDFVRLGNVLIFHVSTFAGGRAAVSFAFTMGRGVHVRMWREDGAATDGNSQRGWSEEGRLADGGCRIIEESPSAQFELEEASGKVYLDCLDITVAVNKKPYFYEIRKAGRVVFSQAWDDFNVDGRYKRLPAGFTYDDSGDCLAIWENVRMYSEEAFYGLGESFMGFDRRGRTYRCWNEDALSGSSKRAYKMHPFFISSRNYAVLLNSYADSSFDMGESSGVSYRFCVRDSVLDYYVLLEKDYKALQQEYGRLKGVPVPPLPEWAFGLWMSRCAYRSQREVQEMVLRAEQCGMALDVINLDAWQDMNKMGTWAWDLEKFPDPAGLIAFLKERGIHLCLWVFPYVFENTTSFVYAREKGFLVADRSGEPVRFRAIADAPARMFAFDFTHPGFVEWYGENACETLCMGIDAIKTDFSEALPESSVFYDGTDGIRGHNRYTYLYAKTVYELLAKAKERTGEQPMLWCRSGSVMSHAIPAAWAGDTGSRPGDHACVLHGGLGLAASGIPFWGFDMGGFYNTAADFGESMPETDDYLKSIQFGMFCPLSRCHGKTPREPWHYGETALKQFVRYDRVRHSLHPYLYGSAWETVRSGIPMIRPLPFEFPKDRGAMHIGDEYMLGSSLLIAPQFDKEPFSYYLPEGRWVNLFTGEPAEGGWHLTEKQPEDIPVFLREHNILPYLTEAAGNVFKNRNNPRGLAVFFSGDFTAQFPDAENTYTAAFRQEAGALYVETDYPASQVRLYGGRDIGILYLNGIPAAMAGDTENENHKLFVIKEDTE